MNLKEKKILKKLALFALIIIGAYLLLQIITSMVTGKEYTDKLISYGYDSMTEYTCEDIEIRFEEDDIIRVEKLWDKDGVIYAALRSQKAGNALMEILDKATGETIAYQQYKTNATGLIINRQNGNFSGYKLSRWYIVFLLAALTILLWYGFVKYLKLVEFSYRSIFCSGFGIWLAVVTLVLLYNTLLDRDMMNIYSALQGFAAGLIMYTSLVVIVFAVLMTISNISLIRHEGFRRNNALGIIISVLLIVGLAVHVLLLSLNLSGSEFELKVISAIIGIYDCIFGLFECFLMGAIICGMIAAKHEPSYDKDYIIILGCKVKEDGTLYPLIKGRVDRAIEFYRAQLEKTGKKAFFIPTGGQGRDENISEAGAMKNYIVGQGIEESRVIIENQAKNTLQNMKFSKNIIDERSANAKAAFSTTNYHVFRSGIISRQAGFDPEGMGSKTKWYFWPNAYVREVIGMITYKWKTLVLILALLIIFMIAIQFVF